jgi:hypothetical protein
MIVKECEHQRQVLGDFPVYSALNGGISEMNFVRRCGRAAPFRPAQ